MKTVFTLLLFFITSLYAQVKETNIEWNSIKASEGKLKLNLVKAWGGDLNNMNESYAMPADICIDKEGNYYVLDMGTNQIFKYDNKGKFLKKIGKKGSGPGDLNAPMAMAVDNMGNIIVNEYGNRRIQILDKNNKSRMLTPEKVSFFQMCTDPSNKIILARDFSNQEDVKLYKFDYNEKLVGKTGKLESARDKIGWPHVSEQSFNYSTDGAGNVYIGYNYGNTFVEKYTPEGKMTNKYKYQLASRPAQIQRSLNGDLPAVTPAGMVSMDTDKEGNIYLLVMKRDITKEEMEKYFAITRAGGNFSESGEGGQSTRETIQPKDNKSSVELFALIVIDKNGNLKGSKTLNYIATKIKVFNNNIFVFTNKDSLINQYKIIM